MKNRLVRTIVILAVVIVLLIAGVPLALRLVYGRSPAATMLVWQLHKQAYTTEEEFDAYLAAKEAENSAVYTLPAGLKLPVDIEERNYNGTQVFVLNAAAPADTLLLCLHGGSYIDQPRETHWNFYAKLAADTGAALAVPIYPKLPSADAAASYAALTAAWDGIRADVPHERALFLGDSAGGGMALSLATRLHGEKEPDGLILICPWVDVTLRNPAVPVYEARDPALDAAMLARLGELWAGVLPPDDPMVSPVYGDVSGLPETLLITTDGELLYPDILRLDEALTAAGVEHTLIEEDNLFHIWPLYAAMNIPESKATYEQIVSFITTA